MPRVYTTELHLTPGLEKRFWAKVNKDGPLPPHCPELGPCWLWTGSVNAMGYGKISHGGRGAGNAYSHRVSYELAHGPIGPALVIDHLCRNHGCQNPMHLEAVLPRTNSLRGEMPYVLLHHAKQCKNGHSLTPDNTYVIQESRKAAPVKRCRACRLAAVERLRAKRTHRPLRQQTVCATGPSVPWHAR
jgi:hypothetical protein